MDEKIIEILDTLSVEQTDKMLQESRDVVEMKISGGQRRRIKQAAYRKAGLKNPRPVCIPKVVIPLAAAAVLLASLYAAGLDSVSAAFSQVFKLLPGQGIQENEEGAGYMLAQCVTVENEEIIFTLENVVAADNGITVSYIIEKKDFDEQLHQRLVEDPFSVDQEIAGVFEWWPDRPETISCTGWGIPPEKAPSVSLRTEGTEVTKLAGKQCIYGKYERSTFRYEWNTEEVSEAITYTLSHGDYNVSLDFQMKNLTYGALEEIGPTGYNNDISITAVPKVLNNKLQVDLYSINKSGYKLLTYGDVNKGGSRGYGPYLETNSGIKQPYEPRCALEQEFYEFMVDEVNCRFVFDIEPTDREFTFKIPYLFVYSGEEQTVFLRMPQEGEVARLNQRVEFSEGPIVIETVETAKGEIQTEDWPEVVLKITLRYDNQSPNIIMCFPGGVIVFDVDDTQIWRQSNFGWDEGGIIGVHAFISSPESDEVKVVFQYPQFWLMDEYALSFSL